MRNIYDHPRTSRVTIHTFTEVNSKGFNLPNTSAFERENGRVVKNATIFCLDSCLVVQYNDSYDDNSDERRIEMFPLYRVRSLTARPIQEDK